MTQTTIPGYTYGTERTAKSPLSLGDLDLMRKTVLLTDEDVTYLRKSYDVLKDQTEAILDVWYGFVGANPHLLHFFTRPSDGQPDTDYLGAVRKRFGQWILDTAKAEFDQAWLDYQHEIALRHHRTKKNQTDGADAVANIDYRYIPLLAYPVTATLKPFLAKGNHSEEEVEKMHQAWVKSVLLQVTLWAQPYVKDGDF